jgi:hypothetical protein
VPLGQRWDGREVDVELVAADNLGDGGLVAGGCGEERGELAEVVLEPGGRDQFEQAGRLVAGVSEGMGDTAGLEDEVAGSCLEHLGAELEAEPAFHHNGVLVLVAVGVERRPQGAWRERVLDQAERAAGPPAVDQEADAEGEQLHGLALAGPEDVANRSPHRVILSLDVLSIESCVLHF